MSEANADPYVRQASLVFPTANRKSAPIGCREAGYERCRARRVLKRAWASDPPKSLPDIAGRLSRRGGSDRVMTSDIVSRLYHARSLVLRPRLSVEPAPRSRCDHARSDCSSFPFAPNARGLRISTVPELSSGDRAWQAPGRRAARRCWRGCRLPRRLSRFPARPCWREIFQTSTFTLKRNPEQCCKAALGLRVADQLARHEVNDSAGHLGSWPRKRQRRAQGLTPSGPPASTVIDPYKDRRRVAVKGNAGGVLTPPALVDARLFVLGCATRSRP